MIWNYLYLLSSWGRSSTKFSHKFWMCFPPKKDKKGYFSLPPGKIHGGCETWPLNPAPSNQLGSCRAEARKEAQKRWAAESGQKRVAPWLMGADCGFEDLEVRCVLNMEVVPQWPSRYLVWQESDRCSGTDPRVVGLVCMSHPWFSFNPLFLMPTACWFQKFLRFHEFPSRDGNRKPPLGSF